MLILDLDPRLTSHAAAYVEFFEQVVRLDQNE